jgi:glutathione synthase
MTFNIGIIMDPIASIDYQKDSTLAMIWEAQARGLNMYYLQVHDMFYRDGKVMANLQRLHTQQVATPQDAQNWYQLSEVETLPMHALDIVLMRKDPPFNMNYIYATYLLEMAQQQGCLVVNHPAALRNCNEKLFALQAPHLCPATLVCSQLGDIQSFHQQYGDMILKPIDGMGGQGVFKINADGQNLAACVEMLTQQGQTPIICQQYIPAIKDGDKRILLINGEPIPYALARIPQADAVRGNLAAGGRAEGRPLTEQDRAICTALKPLLQQAGILFAGIDVIGDYLTEINITSPTCIRQLDTQFKLNISAQLLDCIALLI